MMRKIALICGGPSPERGISLNSARAVMDHLMDVVDVIPFYVDLDKNFYQLDPALLYSNTPSDFDFKLQTGSVILGKVRSTADRGPMSYIADEMIVNGSSIAERLLQQAAMSFLAEDDETEELITILKTCDLVFPVIHGSFGETGELQAFLEQHQIPFVGCGSRACRNMYYKDSASMVLKAGGFDTLPSITTISGVIPSLTDLQEFFVQNNITRAIVKPIAGGSSIGVHSVTSPQQAIDIVAQSTAPMIIEPFCEGREFTVIVLQSKENCPQAGFPDVTDSCATRLESVRTGTQEKELDPGSAPIKSNGLVRETRTPVALVPTEIQISYADGAIFDYRRKYLPTNNTTWACPPNFPDAVIQKIRSDAEAIFHLFDMRDFARLDGWVLDDGRIVFTDMNPISGMEQNSFIFQQMSRLGMTHQEALLYVIAR